MKVSDLPGMPTLDGTLTIVQESRFQVRADDGSSHLFMLSPHAAAEPDQLGPLAARQARVRVTYREGDNVIGAIAEAVYAVAEPATLP